jgi:hypothetical protein
LFKREHASGRLPLSLLAAAAGATLGLWAALPAATTAATVTPESTATCYGSLTAGPVSGEPDSLNYKFNCDSRITAYTVFVDRGGSDYNTIDDFDTSVGVVDPDGSPDSKVTWTCEGYTPSNGFNCNTGGGGVYMGAWSYAEGTFDPTAPYCKSLPVGAKPGTKAIPQALVQLVVTDTTGAQDGPFDIGYAGKCPKVPNRVPAKAKRAKTTTESKITSKTSKAKGSK